MGVIVPRKGEAKQVAKRLLELADDPNEVATTMDGPDGISFVVSDSLYQQYVGGDQDNDDADVLAAEVVDEETVPAPKRRGRPPGSKNKPKTAETEE